MISFHDSLIVRKSVRLLVPAIQLFAVYVYIHGHYSPGGGFQGGVLWAAAILLRTLTGSDKNDRKINFSRELIIAAGGLFLYTSAGLLALSFQDWFLDYGAIRIFGHEEAWRRYWGILMVEGGVFVVVAMTIILIFHSLMQPASPGKTK